MMCCESDGESEMMRCSLFQIYSGVQSEMTSLLVLLLAILMMARLSRALMYARTSTRSLESAPRTSHAAVVRMSTSDSSGDSSSSGESVGRKKRILSGVQPTGSLHLGNYLGAIRQWCGRRTSILPTFHHILFCYFVYSCTHSYTHSVTLHFIIFLIIHIIALY